MLIVRPTNNPFSGELVIYPFLPADATPAQIAAHGYIEAFIDTKRLDLFGIVKWNLALDAMTQEKWDTLNSAMHQIFHEISMARRTIVPDRSERWSVEGWEAGRGIKIRLSSNRRFAVVADRISSNIFFEQLNADETAWMNGDKTRDPFRSRYIETLPSFLLEAVRREIGG